MKIEKENICWKPELEVSANLIKITKTDPIAIDEEIYKSNETLSDEAIYIDSIKRMPMYCPDGVSFIDNIIQIIKDKKTGWEKEISGHEALIKNMLQHNILQYKQNSSQDKCSEHIEKKPAVESQNEIRQRPGVSLYLLLSQSCNLGCIYCLNGEESYCKSSHLHMDEKTAIKAIERYAREIKPNGRMEIVFFGGEPLLNWDLAKRIMEQVTNFTKNKFPLINFKFHLTSNLYKIPSDLVEYAHKYNMTFLCEIIGPPEIHDKIRPNRAGHPSCEQIVKNVQYLIKEGFKVPLRATITSHNHHLMPEIARFHKEIGGSGSAYVLLNPMNSDEKAMPKEWLPDIDVYLNGLQEILSSNIWKIEDIFPLNEYINRIGNPGQQKCSCGAPYGNTPTIDVNGNVYPCIYWVGMNRFLLGNIHEEGELKNISLCDDLIEKLNVENREECVKCKWKYLCGGGCAVNYVPAIYKFKNLKNVDPAIVNYMLNFTCKLTPGCLSICQWHLVNKKLNETNV